MKKQNWSTEQSLNGMQRLRNHMEINEMLYELITRNDDWAVFSIQGGRRYEVLRIYVLPGYYDRVWWHNFPERESVSGAGQFMRDGSKFFDCQEKALVYFVKLTCEAN